MEHHVRAGEVVAGIPSFTFLALHWLGVHVGQVASALSALYTMCLLGFFVYDKFLRRKRRK